MSPSLRPVFLLFLLALATGCGQTDRAEISLSRPLTEAESRPVTGATSADRFKFAMPAAPRPAPAPASGPRLAWDVPPGWKETSHPMRDVSLSFGAEGECYVMRAGGSLTENVNRWRKQMGLPEISAEEAEALPTRLLFGTPAYRATLDGDYSGVGAEQASTGYRMIGVILPLADAGTSLFVKMVGPRELVEQNQAAFDAFCDSLRIVTS